MKILITGGTGFLGRAAAIRLSQAGHEVSVLGRNPKVGEALQKAGLRFLKVDLADAEAVISACKAQELVIHSGALASPWGSYQLFYEANLLGSRNIVKGCQVHGVRRLVNISTPSVYFDYRHRLNIKESDPLPQKQATHYASTKLAADMEVAQAQKQGLETISIRPRAIFGPGDQTVLGRVMKAAKSGIVPLVDGGRSFIDMTYVENVVDAILLCMNAPKHLLGKTFNITNGEPMPTRQMLELLFHKLNAEVRYRKVPFAVAYGAASLVELFYKALALKEEPVISRYAVGLMSKSQTLDITLARKELGYVPKVSIDKGLDLYCQWWLSADNNPQKNLRP